MHEPIKGVDFDVLNNLTGVYLGSILSCKLECSICGENEVRRRLL